MLKTLHQILRFWKDGLDKLVLSTVWIHDPPEIDPRPRAPVEQRWQRVPFFKRKKVRVVFNFDERKKIGKQAKYAKYVRYDKYYTLYIINNSYDAFLVISQTIRTRNYSTFTVSSKSIVITTRHGIADSVRRQWSVLFHINTKWRSVR